LPPVCVRFANSSHFDRAKRASPPTATSADKAVGIEFGQQKSRIRLLFRLEPKQSP
jgi:hypothetical protein